jgi:sugar/nucleoside kinase (ribokinase family)
VKPKDVKPDFVKSFQALHIMGSSLSINENLRNACYTAVKIARKSGMIVSYDPNLRAELMRPREMRRISEPVLNACRVMLPSKQELFDLTGKTSLDNASQRIFRYGVEELIVKLGAEGFIAMNRQEHVFESAYSVPEVDPTGAGDAFDAAMILGHLRKWELRTLLDFANAVGALKVRNVGPMEVPTSFSEVTKFMRSNKKKA